MRTALPLAVGLLQVAPRLAAACPVCAGREEASGTGWLLAGMIAAPFAVAAVAVALVRRLVGSGRQPNDHA